MSVDGVIITTENFGLCFTGVFNGDTQGMVTIIVNLSTGSGVFFGQNTFTGTIITPSSSASGTIFVPFAATFSSGNFRGEYSLHGSNAFGTIQGAVTTFVGTYTATLFTSSENETAPPASVRQSSSPFSDQPSDSPIPLLAAQNTIGPETGLGRRHTDAAWTRA